LRVEDQAKAAAHERLVVGNQNTDHRSPALNGNRARRR
jgi:hypothetical protein